METKDSERDQPTAPARPLRWWPVAVILLLAAAVLIWIWGWYGLTRQHRNLATASVVFWTSVLLSIWLLFFSRARKAVRWLTFLGAIAAIGLAASLFRIRGVTGDLVPILEWRWQPKSLAAIEPPAPAPQIGAIIPSTNDYPQFLGPERTGILKGPRLARDWKTRPPEQIWRRPMGPGWSGFAVAANVAITQEQRGEEELVTCYDRQTGQPLWTHADPVHYHTIIAGEGPRATPTIHSNRVYTVGGTGILNCLELASGKPVWTKDIIQDNRSHIDEWGVSCSPLICDDRVIVSAGGKLGRSLVAYHKETGAFVWGGGEAGPGYSSPALATLAGVRQILIFNSGGVAAHAVDSGVVLWEYAWPRGHPHVTQPVVLHDDRVVVSSGYGVGSELLKISNDGEWSATRVWKSNRLKPKFTNLVPLRGFLYGLDDGILVCLDVADGQLKWKEGRYGHGQIILVDELLLLMAEQGDVVLIEPVPTELRELTRFTAFKNKTWNSPALAGEFLLVRNDKEAACYRLPVLP